MEGKDIRVKGIEIELDKARHLVFDLNAFCELEDKYGDISKAFGALQSGSIKAIRYLLYAGLLHEDESLTEKKVGSFVNLQNIDYIANIITESMSNSMPEVDENENNNEKN